MPTIRLCESNLDQGAQYVLMMIRKELSTVDVSVEDCINLCDACEDGPIAIVDDQLIKGKSPQELYQKIREIVIK